ncbi:carotenoid biosynthesis protein [Tunturibacter empetritectus]|uniref:Membrane protein n=1 Tax=Tunturiibacter lichenicola TaxID=2051959 RepID=A0A7W8J9V7_9BACT|nr:carotenoid biosynthesis protein [Edaphobacter lichenicola]MBB5345308.1 putative membrane protein [Edaphobacter lichenicola]
MLSDRSSHVVCWLLLLFYAVGRLLQLEAGRVPTLTIVLLHVVPLAAFALIHGVKAYRLRGMLVFVGLSLGVGFVFESLSLRTGFPFGHYYFTDVMGPKFFQLPVLLVLAYVGMGYVSWMMALLILNSADDRLGVRRWIALPVVASFLMVAWDFAMDPVWADIDRAWVWKDGGAYFGVPVSNYFGWYLTVYVVYQLFALYLRGTAEVQGELSRRYWRMPVIVYGVCAIGNVVLAIPRESYLVSDGSGRQWRSSDIVGTCVIVSIFVMGSFASLAWARVSE